MSDIESSTWRRRLPWCAAILVCLLVDLAFNPAIFDSTIRVPGDVVQHFPPNWSDAPRTPIRNTMVQDWVVQFQRWQRLVRESWLEGRAPLWNQLAGCGVPLAANMQSEAFSPYLPLNLATAEQYPDWRQLAQLLIAQLSCFWLARRLKIGVFGTLVIALGYSFTYYMQVWAMHPHSASASFAPAILAGFLGLRINPRKGPVLGLAILIACSLLAGHIETAFKETFAAGLLAFLWIPRRSFYFSGLFKFVVAAVTAGVLAMCLAAVLLLPFAEMVQSSMLLRIRTGSSAIHLDVAHVSTLLDHQALGSGLSGEEVYRGPRNYLETSFFMGRTILLLALAGLIVGMRRRPSLVLPLALLALAPLVVVHGPPALQEHLFKIPPFGSMLATRLVFITTLPLCILAGLGVDGLWLARGKAKLERFLSPVIAVLGGALIFLVQHWSKNPEVIQIHWLSWAVVAAGLVAILVAGVSSRWALSASMLVLLALIVGEGMVAWRDFIPTVGREAIRPQSAILRSLAGRTTGERLLTISLMPPGMDEPYDLNRIRRYDAVESRRFNDMFYEAPISPIGPGFEISFSRTATLDAMAVGWLLTPFPAQSAVRPTRRHDLRPGESVQIPSGPGMELLFVRRTGNPADGTISLERGGDSPLSWVLGSLDQLPPNVVTKMDQALKEFLSTYLHVDGVEFLRISSAATDEPVKVIVSEAGIATEIYEIKREGLGAELEERDNSLGWIRLTERLSAMPLAYMANRVAKTTCHQSAMEMFRAATWRPQNQTIVEIEESDDEPFLVTKKDDVTPVEMSREAPGAFRLKFPDDHGGVLVLSESYAPGWFCRHSLGESEALPANVGLMAFRIPPGVKEASVEYCPRSFVVGAWLSLGTLFGMIIALIRGLVLKRRKTVMDKGLPVEKGPAAGSPVRDQE